VVGRTLLLADGPAGEPPEGSAEVRIVEGVDERVDGAVDPANPGEAEHEVLEDGGSRQEGYQQIIDEEGQPASN